MAERVLGVRLSADDTDLRRALGDVADHSRKAARELEGALGKSLTGATKDMQRLSATAPGVAAALLRMEGAQDRYNRSLVKFGAESRQARTALAAVADQQDRLATATRRAETATAAHTTVVKRSSRVMAVAKGAAAGYAAVIGVTGLIGAARSSINAASDLNEQLSKSQVVFGEASKSVIAFSRTTAGGLGISQRAALGAAGTFGNMLVPMGFARTEAARMSTRMVSLAADMASFNNADPSETLEALRAGLAGETEPLRRFGVSLSDAALRAYALAEGIKVGKGPLDAQTKATLTYGLVLRQTKDQQGDFARTNNGLANQQRILRARFEELSAKIGSALVPAMISVTSTVNRYWPQIEAAAGGIREAVKGTVEFVKAVIDRDWDKAWRKAAGAADRVGPLLKAGLRAAAGWVAGAARDLGAAVARGIWAGFDSALQQVPGSGALRRVLGMGSADVSIDSWGADLRTRFGTSVTPPAQPAVRLRARGGWIDGPAGAGDVVPAMLTPGEVVLNRRQQELIGWDRIHQVVKATGGVIGGNRFARGGVVDAALQFARAQVGEPYVWGAGHEGVVERRGWDCSGFASNVAARVPGYRGGIGTTMTLYPASTTARGGEPLVFGFRGMNTGDPRRQHMGVRVNGTWFDAGSGGVQVGDSRWDAVKVPPGLEYLTDGGGPDPGAAAPTTPTGDGITVKQARSLIPALMRGGGATQPGLTDVPSITRRHADDQIQERRAQSRGASRVQIMEGQRVELMRDLQDLAKALDGLQRRRREALTRRAQLRGKALNPKTPRAARGKLMEALTAINEDLTGLADAIIAVRQERQNVAWQAEALGLDIRDALREDQAPTSTDPTTQTGDVAIDTGGAEPQTPVATGLSDQDRANLTSARDLALAAADFGEAAMGPGDISRGGRTAWGAAWNNAGPVNVVVQALHPGDPGVLRSIAAAVTRALDGQSSVPSSVIPSGA